LSAGADDPEERQQSRKRRDAAEDLAYAACVKAELDAGYTAATLMQVSIDPAWQDSDAKFRQIIVRCTKYAEF
jgi:hypothetical protein